MIIKRNHSFHLVDQRPWPLTGALGALILTSGIVKWFHLFNPQLFILGLLILGLTCIQWWRDIRREGTLQGLHTFIVAKGLRWGIILFITSEVLFFFSFFWAFFHRRLAPTIEIGLQWPPLGISPFNPLQVPLLNTLILLARGVTVTWAHHGLIERKFTQSTQGLLITVILGVYFTCLQGIEYWEARFSLADSAYGRTFFVATGFHGLHVIIGTTFLLTCLFRHLSCHFSQGHHFGFEAAAWYWHFVDVVWLFLYITIYWWGRYIFIIQVYLTSNQKVHHLENVIFIITTLSLALSIILIFLNSAIAKKSFFDREKPSPFECGFDPKRSARIPFSLRFYLVALIFLIFDVEITLILPIPLFFIQINITLISIVSSFFLLILVLGLFHEWNEGALEWDR